MSHDSQSPTPLFQLDTTADSFGGNSADSSTDDSTELLRELVKGQQRQNELLEELTQQLSASQRQRASELGQWKKANPRLASDCRYAAESLGRVQTQFLETLTEEINENSEGLIEGDFLLNEFVDRFGPRLAHLNGVLQILSQLSSVPNPANSQP